MPRLNPATAARAGLIVAAVLFSTGGAVIKSIDISAAQVASFRSLVAAAVLLALLPESRRLLRLDVWLVGAAFASTMILYVWANRLTTAANTIYLQATAPLYLVPLAPLLLKERPGRRDLLLMLFLALGMVLFFLDVEPPSGSASQPRLGNLLAACSGLSWALTILGLRHLGRSDDASSPIAAVSAGSLLAFLFALPLALPVTSFPLDDALLVIFLGVFQIGLAYVFLTRSIRRVPAFQASLLLLLEPVLNPLWAFLIHTELPGGFALIGCALILTATLVQTLAARRDAG